MRTVILTLAAMSLVLPLVGCKKATVDEDKSKADFISDVKTKLAAYDKRIDKVKSQIGGREEAVKVKIETTTEMAEKSIEAIRNTQIPTLEKAAKEDTIGQAKSDINASLKTIDGKVREAEDVLNDAKTDREKVAENLQTKIDTLKKELADAREKAENLSEPAKARFNTAADGAEEAFDEAGKALNKYKSAAEDQAGAIQDNVSELIAEGQGRLDEARKNLTGE